MLLWNRANRRLKKELIAYDKEGAMIELGMTSGEKHRGFIYRIDRDFLMLTKARIVPDTGKPKAYQVTLRIDHISTYRAVHWDETLGNT